ncbi:DUF6950 family protein [Aureimonas frigidaquae]|uniref:DUF6950 family protein n=1 Tax=Aureimonas frigidaquae TaxID=424757 RepID=UPI0007862CC2|nr:hypothetical protein [Aureimonas frigidaquae]
MADLLGDQDKLGAFLKAAAERPFSWGHRDCLLWLADWVEECRGIDPAAHLRGSYCDEAEAEKVIVGHGGREAMIDALLAPLGIRGTQHPQAGDIALVSLPSGVTGGIVTGKFIAFIGHDRLRFTRAPIIKAWSLGCPQLEH